MMMPMHATVAILTALGTWNDVMTPLVIMSGTGQNTLPLAQLNFQTQFGTNYNLAFASYIMAPVSYTHLTEVERRLVDSRKVKVDFSLENMDCLLYTSRCV